MACSNMEEFPVINNSLSHALCTSLLGKKNQKTLCSSIHKLVFFVISSFLMVSFLLGCWLLQAILSGNFDKLQPLLYLFFGLCGNKDVFCHYLTHLWSPVWPWLQQNGFELAQVYSLIIVEVYILSYPSSSWLATTSSMADQKAIVVGSPLLRNYMICWSNCWYG